MNAPVTVEGLPSRVERFIEDVYTSDMLRQMTILSVSGDDGFDMREEAASILQAISLHDSELHNHLVDQFASGALNFVKGALGALLCDMRGHIQSSSTVRFSTELCFMAESS
ncbi:hypothetical protein H7X69_03130 [Candidatus Saccharibacteria bacterium]|nr:hypothetical protein [Candidatus Saccharibacteria bacterium]